MKKLIIAVIVGLTLASCGSSSKTGAPTTAAPAATTAAPAATTATTTAPAVTSAPTVAPTEATTAPTEATTAPTEASTNSSTVAGGSTAAGTSVSVKIADTALGKIIVEADGTTLYMFSKDTKGASNCTGGCASAWPPLIGTPTNGAGVDAGDVSTITRPDGTKQVTFYGFPLYTFKGDAKPGDTNGQGEGGVWYVVDSSGTPVKTAAPTTAP